MAELALTRFAAVSAALAEGFTLEEVLAVEGLDATTWASAEMAWTPRLAEDGSDLASYRVALDAAEDRLARRIDPLDHEVGAWLSFLAAFSAAKEPAELLSACALGVNDLSRLQRAWTRKAVAERGLEKRIEQLKKRGVAPLPPVRAAKRTLRASEEAEAERRAAAARPGTAAPLGPGVTSAPEAEMPLERYATLSAELARARGDEARVLAKFGVPEASRAALDRSFRARFERDLEARKDFARLRAHHVARLAAAAAEVGPKSSRALPPPPPARAAPEKRPPREETVIGPSPISRAALPFGDAASPAFLDALSRPASAPEGAGLDGATVLLPSPFAARVAEEQTYVLSEDTPPPVVSAPLSTKLPPSAATAKPIVDTVSAVHSPFAELPFAAPPRVEPPEDAPARFEIEDDETTTFFEADELVAEPEPEPEVIPLERHASLCVEIALDGGPEGALERYKVSSDEKQRADAQWRDVFSRDPAQRAAWNRAFDLYRAWYAARLRP